MDIAFFGSSLLSSYWNGAATYYRGIIKALAARGWKITFFEPDAFDRQQHRDIEPPEWAEVVVFDANDLAVADALRRAAEAKIVIKASGIGVFDDEILREVIALGDEGKIVLYWDVDAPATLAEISSSSSHLLRSAVPMLDAVLTYGGGEPVVEGYEVLGARLCLPIYNALDPATHFPVGCEGRFKADLTFLGNRLPDREARVDAFFLEAARRLPDRHFLLAGAGWEGRGLPPNVRAIGHVSTLEHNALNASALAIINISRDSMASTGFSPATRVFEAAGSGACIITDAWEGIAQFLTPGEEILVARDGRDVAEHLGSLTASRAAEIGGKAHRRIMREHTYDRRAEQVDCLFRDLIAQKRIRAVA